MRHETAAASAQALCEALLHGTEGFDWKREENYGSR
jgi:hypothetical protein